MVGINYSEIKEKKRIAMIFSIICPGMGLVFYEKWVLGVIHAVLHVVFWVLILVGLVRNIVYQLSEFHNYQNSPSLQHVVKKEPTKLHVVTIWH